MMGKYQELRDALSQNPTPGPWSAYISGNTMQVDSTPQASGGRPCVVFWPGFDGNDLSVRANAKNTRYIAAANPEAIRALLADRDALRGHLAELIAICEPNLYPCPDKPNSKWAKLMAAKAALTQQEQGK